MRDALIAATIDLLEREGPAGVQARALTREIGASTKVIYHHFGGIPQLLRAARDEGFTRLDTALSAVPISDDPIVDLLMLGLAYRASAWASPHLYDLMFGLAAPGGHRPTDDEPTGVPSAPSTRAFSHLVAAQLWSMLHGFVTLELADNFSTTTDDAVTAVLLPLTLNLLVGLGADPEHLQRIRQRSP